MSGADWAPSDVEEDPLKLSVFSALRGLRILRVGTAAVDRLRLIKLWRDEYVVHRGNGEMNKAE